MWGILPFPCISVWWPWESATTYLLQSLVVQRLTFAHSCWYISVAWPADWAQCLLWKIIDSLELLKNKCRRVCEFLNKPNHSLQFNLPVLVPICQSMPWLQSSEPRCFSASFVAGIHGTLVLRLYADPAMPTREQNTSRLRHSGRASPSDWQYVKKAWPCAFGAERRTHG